MRNFKPFAAAGLAAAIVAAGATVGGASAAAPTGVGTAKTATSVLSVQLGDGSLLALRVGGENSQSTIDKAKAGSASAYTRVSPLTLGSKAVSALNVSLPAIEAKAPGGQATVPAVTVPLDTPATSGSLALTALTASVDTSGAKSGLTSSIDNLGLVGGLLSVPKISSTLSTSALSASADGVRGVNVPSVVAVDLGALLDGLGLKLTDLPISTITGLLGQLGIVVPGLDEGVSLDAAVAVLQKAITDTKALLTVLGTTTGTLPGGVGTTVGGIIGGVGGVLDTVGGTTGLLGLRTVQQLVPLPVDPLTTVEQVTQLVDTLTNNLTTILGSALGVLDAAPLLSVNGLEVGLLTKATDTLQNSAANVTAKIGSVNVGGKSLGGVDIAGQLTQVTNLLNSVTGALTGALGTIDPGLADLVSVRLFDQSKDVKAVGEYSTATARLTALTATIKPPVDLGAIVSRIQGLTGIGDVLGTLGVNLQALPQLSTAMSQLESVLGAGLQALSQGAVVRVADLSSSAEYLPSAASSTGAPAPASAPGAELPRTGADNAPVAVLGVLLLALAAALVRWLRRPVDAL